MAKTRSNPKWQVNGIAEAGYYAYFYEEGTTTPKDTYTDYTEGAANTNPVILDARGEADVWFSGAYKVAVYTGDKDTDGVLIWTVDGYGKGEDIAASTGSFNLAQNGSFESDSILSGEPDSWTIVDYTDGSHSIDATTQFYGLNSLKFTSAGTGGGYATSEFFEVQEGRYLSTQFATQSTVATVRNVVDLIWYTAAQTLISTTNAYDDSTTNPTTWTFKKSLDIVPSTARYAKIRIYGCHSSDATVGSTWFDNIVVSPLLGTMGEQDSDVISVTGGSVEGLTLLDTEEFSTKPTTTAGTGTAYTADVSETAYVTDRIYNIQIHTDNTAACTVDLDSIGAKSVKLLDGSDPYLSSLKTGKIAKLLYDGTNLVLLNHYIDPENNRPDLYYLGTGSDGAKTVSSSENLASGEYHYTSLSVSAGQTLGLSSATGGLVIRCTGTVTLIGDVDADGKGELGGVGAGTIDDGISGSFGGSGGSGGADGSVDSAAGGDITIRNTFISGGAAKVGDGAGNNGVSLAATSSAVRSIASFGNDLIKLSGGAGGGGGSGGTGGDGGGGGGYVIIIADTIDFQSSAVITADGANGANSVNDGGGGGGGGGFILLAAKTITNDGTTTVTGGTGGTGVSSYNGGDGGDGYSATVVL